MRYLFVILVASVLGTGCTPFPTAPDGTYLEHDISCDGAQASCYAARPFFPEPVPAPPAEPELKWVYFDFDRSIAEGVSFADFNPFLDYYANKKVYLRGFTDPLGNEDYNLRLAEARVNFVRRQMIAQGVAPERIVVEALGESQPRHKLAKPQKEYEYDALISELAPDRRVEISLE